MIKFSDIVATVPTAEKTVWNKPLSLLKDEEVTDVARELFPTTTKARAIYQNDYQYITTEQMKQYLDSLNNFFVSADVVHRLEPERLRRLQTSGTIYPKTDHTGIIQNRETYKFTTFGMQIPDEDEHMWVRDTVQSGIDMYDVQILKIPTKEYKGIVPVHVVETAVKHHGNFDEIAILEPKITKLSPAPELMDDPILVGYMKAFPDRVFLLDYWQENVSVDQIATKANLSFPQGGGSNGNTLRTR